MSDVKKKGGARRWIVRAVLVAVYAGVMVFAFVFGKSHTLLVDNKDVEGRTDLVAFDDVVVGVDKLETTELASGDRDMFKVRGQRHRVTLEIMGRPDKVVKEITIPIGDTMTLLNIPKLAAGVEPYTEPFVQKQEGTPDRSSESFSIGPADTVTETDGNAASADAASPAPAAGTSEPAAAKP